MQTLEAFERGNERVLNQVVGLRCISQQPRRNGCDEVHVFAVECLRGPSLALNCPTNQHLVRCLVGRGGA
jgi:hypothetical protein